jgi:hypothetical protein
MMTALVVCAFEGTVPTTAMPSIVRELGNEGRDVGLFSWVYTAFLMGSATAIPVFGKLADRVGRRPAFAGGMMLFLLGSVLCGTATSMHQLIAYRALQGLGAGAIGPLIPTVISDLYSLEARARVQGLFTGAWGIANAIGPLAGGLIVSYGSWRWVFLINVPLGCAAAALLLVSHVDPAPNAVQKTAPAIDVTGTVMFALTAAALLLAIDVEAPLSAGWRAALLLVTALAGAGLVYNQRTTASPLIPREALSNGVVRTGAIGSLFAGALMYTVPAYVALWFATERHETAIAAGLALIPFLLAWAAGGMLGVRSMVQRGPIAVAVKGATIAAIGSGLLAIAAAANAPSPVVFVALVVTGLGVGGYGSATQIGPQMAVGWSSRGAVTALVQVGRTLGGAAAMAVLAMARPASVRFSLLTALTIGGVFLVASARRGSGVRLGGLADRVRQALPVHEVAVDHATDQGLVLEGNRREATRESRHVG